MNPDIYTSEARHLAAGWSPSDPMIRIVLQREAFVAAIARLAENGVRDESAIHAAVTRGDMDGIVAAVTRHQVGVWCDEMLQRPSQLTDWNTNLLDAISALVAKDPQGVLASLDAIDDPENDGAWLRKLANGYREQGNFIFGLNGQPLPAQAVRVASTILPRHIAPLRSVASTV